jgi:hypothetical protein
LQLCAAAGMAAAAVAGCGLQALCSEAGGWFEPRRCCHARRGQVVNPSIYSHCTKNQFKRTTSFATVLVSRSKTSKFSDSNSPGEFQKPVENSGLKSENVFFSSFSPIFLMDSRIPGMNPE